MHWIVFNHQISEHDVIATLIEDIQVHMILCGRRQFQLHNLFLIRSV